MLAQLDRRAASYNIDDLAGDDYVPGAATLDRWCATYDEAADLVRDLYGPGVSIYAGGFVPDKWRTLSRDDVEGVYPGDEVGATSPGVGPVLGAHDRPHGWDRRAEG
ncbi:hypothetical protein AB0N38_04250 [Micromonospora aurantiaca]|uniref:hypothetical protein n=1 Tax=Micromonospora aurantiaca (nom. illeg.) TaxID=47850 RepID=UPI00343380D9